ncbi:MAG: AfsR/SARP family transcriptional regulator [Gaiellaceae bacterium]
MEFGILGPLEVRDGGRVLPVHGTKQRALLAVLLLHANEVVSSDRLIDSLWSDQAPATAANTLQVHVSRLRRLLEPSGSSREILLTRPPGYVLRVAPGELDLHRFESMVEAARQSLSAGEPAAASASLREGLALWRGSPLSDFASERFAQAPIERLEELRLTAHEERVEADLGLGRHRELVGELRALTAEHPLRERLCGQLMLALYRCGRQAEALEVFQEARRTLVGELGIEPGHELQRLEKAILRQDPVLEPPTGELSRERGEAPVGIEPAQGARAILLAAFDSRELDVLLPFAAALAGSQPPHELIIARLLVPQTGNGGAPGQDQLALASAELDERRGALAAEGVAARVVAFTSTEPGHDIVRLASEQDVDLLLLEPGRLFGAEPSPAGLDVVLEGAPCDVGLVLRRENAGGQGEPGAPVLVTFAGAEHDWTAVELGAWIARAEKRSLVLVGPAGDPSEGRRDSSRVLATASLVVQQFAGIAAHPLLTGSGAEGIVEAAARARLLIVGFSSESNRSGLGALHARIAEQARAPTVFVRRGLRPGGLAPRAGVTRFTWSLGGETEQE